MTKVKAKMFDGSTWTNLCDQPVHVRNAANSAFVNVDVTDSTRIIKFKAGGTFYEADCTADSSAVVLSSLYMCYSDYPTAGVTMTFTLAVPSGWTANGLMRMAIVDPSEPDDEIHVVYDGVTPLGPLTSPVSLPGTTDFNGGPFTMRLTFKVTDGSSVAHLFYIDFHLLKTLPSPPEAANYRCTPHYTNLILTELP